MAQQTPLDGVIASKSSELTGVSPSACHDVTHEQHTKQLVHRVTAIGVTKNITSNEHLKSFWKTRRNNIRKQKAVGIDLFDIDVEVRRETILSTSDLPTELHAKSIAAPNCKFASSMEWFGRTVCEIRCDDILRIGTFA